MKSRWNASSPDDIWKKKSASRPKKSTLITQMKWGTGAKNMSSESPPPLPWSLHWRAVAIGFSCQRGKEWVGLKEEGIRYENYWKEWEYKDLLNIRKRENVYSTILLVNQFITSPLHTNSNCKMRPNMKFMDTVQRNQMSRGILDIWAPSSIHKNTRETVVSKKKIQNGFNSKKNSTFTIVKSIS